MAELQIPAAQVSSPAGRAGFRNLFHVLRDLRDRAWSVFLGAVLADVPERFPLRLHLFLQQSLVEN